MDLHNDGNADEQRTQLWNEMLDGLDIDEQLWLFCEAVRDAKTMVSLVNDFGCRLHAAKEAGVLGREQFDVWEEAGMEYVKLIVEEALAMQEDE